MPTENQTSSPNPKNPRDRTERHMVLLAVLFWIGLIVLLVNVPEGGYSFLHTETAEIVEELLGIRKVTAKEEAALEYLPQVLGGFVGLVIVGNTIALLSERRRRKEREQHPTAKTAKN